jgi:hypothetical protein
LQDIEDHRKPGGAASPTVADIQHVTLDDTQPLTTSEAFNIQTNLSRYPSQVL